MGRAIDLVSSAHQWLKKIFKIFLKRFCSGKKKRYRYSSSSLWRKIERRGKMHEVFLLYTNGTLDLSHSRATATGLTGTQSRVLTQDSNSEKLLRNFAVKNWNSMTYAQRKPFIDLALEKRKWLKRIDERNIPIIDSLDQLDTPKHDVSNMETETRHEPEPEFEPEPEPEPEAELQPNSSNISTEISCQSQVKPTLIPDVCVTSGANSQHDMTSHKESDNEISGHRPKRKSGIYCKNLEEANQLDIQNQDGPNIVTRANRKKTREPKKRLRANLRHRENSRSFSEMKDESSTRSLIGKSNKIKKQCMKNRDVSEEVQKTPKKKESKKLGTVFLK
ncbi:uncharacterized protein LOC119687182 [Teleopsis dalmanni]|uniref:uncharacterized protein LOC119687182 n=1 Tax=Teleopsis dalmanni TaxID=139649 RepID=UPI0018CEE123|nr:uncharacterized protein LOC119687182 [Teleopsis dalmanni]